MTDINQWKTTPVPSSPTERIKMLQKLRLSNKEDGFTLIEILVVILIIGILASIAIPVFLNQRKQANEAALRSDMKNLALAIEQFFLENPTDPDVNFANDVKGFKSAKGATFAIRGNANTWCIVGSHNNSDYSNMGNVSTALTYDSVNGGMMPKGWNWHTQSKCETPETVWSWWYG